MSTNIVTLPAHQIAKPQSIFSNQDAFMGALKIAETLASSTLVPADYKGNPSNVVIAMEIANRTGSSIFAVMQSLYIVHGRPAWSAQYIIATVNATGRFKPLRFDIGGEGDARQCVAWTTEIGSDERLEGPAVTIRMAKEEGWFNRNGSKWKTMPELMLRYRAATFFGRLYAPEILMGLKTMDEIQDVYGESVTSGPAINAKLAAAVNPVVDTETGEIQQGLVDRINAAATMEELAAIKPEIAGLAAGSTERAEAIAALKERKAQIEWANLPPAPDLGDFGIAVREAEDAAGLDGLIKEAEGMKDAAARKAAMELVAVRRKQLS